MKDHCCRRCIVTGRVQGVFFRASTASQAQNLGLTGHAINLPDGGVEVLACGDSRAVKELCLWLRHGPPMARVDNVKIVDVSGEDAIPSAFSTG